MATIIITMMGHWLTLGICCVDVLIVYRARGRVGVGALGDGFDKGTVKE